MIPATPIIIIDLGFKEGYTPIQGGIHSTLTASPRAVAGYGGIFESCFDEAVGVDTTTRQHAHIKNQDSGKSGSDSGYDNQTLQNQEPSQFVAPDSRF